MGGGIIFISLLRTIILYVFIVFIMRVMGKRQLGDLQASELVITLLISGIAAIPLQDTGIPLIHSIVCIAVLASMEIIVSVISIKIPFIRRLLFGNSITVIRNGVLNQSEMKRLRLSIEELLNELRTNGVFELSDVQYATLETNGMLSVLLKPGKRPPTAEMVTDKLETVKRPYLVIEDGSINQNQLKASGLGLNDISRELKKRSLDIKEVFILTADADKNYYVIKKEKNKQTKGGTD